MSLLVPYSPHNCVPNNFLRQLLTSMVDGDQIYFMKSRSHSFTISNCFLRVHSTGTLQLPVNVGESSKVARYFQPISTDLTWHPTFDEELRGDSSSESLKSCGNEHDKEIERRRKIGLANKGKIPWNKGRNHSAETRERIKRRTIEALRDPKVRKKMADRPRTHSNEIKTKIGVSQKIVWRKRLKLKSLKEKLYVIWAQRIAEAAKRGGHDQQELEWDSFKRMEAELALQQLQWAAEKAKAKEIAKLRAARDKAEKMARHAQKKKEEEEKKAIAREIKKRIRAKSKEENQKAYIPKRLMLKARITKSRRKKCVDDQVALTGDVTTAHQPTIEKLDLEFIKREKLRREVSLADQIEAAKKKRAESAAKEALTSLPLIS